jgi:hypothetical protein
MRRFTPRSFRSHRAKGKSTFHLHFEARSGCARRPSPARLQHRAFTIEPVHDPAFRETADSKFANDLIAGNDRNAGSLHFAGRATSRKTTVIELDAKETTSQGRGNSGVARDEFAAAMRMPDHGDSPRLQMPGATSRTSSAALTSSAVIVSD